MTREIVRDESDVCKAVETTDLEARLRDAMRRVAEELMESEVTELLGAEPWERSEERRGLRNGHRSREWDTRLGRVSLQVPKVREGGYLPSFLEPRRRVERALVAVIQEAYIHGVSTRKVDDLVRVLGGSASKSAVSRICEGLDEEGRAFRERAIEAETPYVWLDALYEKARDGGHVRSTAVVVAIGVTAEGTRTVLGVDVGNSEDESFWKSFLRSLVRRGMKGVQLVISDAHTGLQKAVRQVMQGATWQRCRVHTLRNILSHVPRGQQAMVAATVRTLFAQPSQAEARKQLGQVVKLLRDKCPQAAEVLEEAAEDVLAYMAFPAEHWRQIHSTNPLERLNKEIRRRTRVVGIFPSRASLLRLVSAVLAEQDDEWQAAERGYFSKESMAKVSPNVKAPPRLMKEVATA